MVELALLLQQPIYITSAVAFFVGFTYYLGWIRNANDWQYQNSDKQGNLIQGFYFLFWFLLLPGFVLYAIISLFNLSAFFIAIPPAVYAIALFALLLFLQKLDSSIMKEVIKGEDSAWPGFIAGIAGIAELKYVFILSNLGLVFSPNTNIVYLAFAAVFDLIILTQWSRLSNLHRQGSKGIITLKSSSSNNAIECRIIEFVGKSAFLKVQEKVSKKIYAIPVSRIERIEAIEERPDIIKSIFSHVIKSVK